MTGPLIKRCGTRSTYHWGSQVGTHGVVVEGASEKGLVPDLEILWNAAGSAVMEGMSRFADVDAALWLLWRSSSTVASDCAVSKAVSTSSCSMFFPCNSSTGLSNTLAQLNALMKVGIGLRAILRAFC